MTRPSKPAKPARRKFEFYRKIEKTGFGLRVSWTLAHDPLSKLPLCVTATADGVYLCGSSPALDPATMKALAEVLGMADVASAAIADGISQSQLHQVFLQIEREAAEPAGMSL